MPNFQGIASSPCSKNLEEQSTLIGSGPKPATGYKYRACKPVNYRKVKTPLGAKWVIFDRAHFCNLPDEILLNIMLHIQDVKDLSNLNINIKVPQDRQTISLGHSNDKNADGVMSLLKTLRSDADLASHVQTLSIDNIVGVVTQDDIKYVASAALKCDLAPAMVRPATKNWGLTFNGRWLHEPLAESLELDMQHQDSVLRMLILSLIIIQLPNLRELRIGSLLFPFPFQTRSSTKILTCRLSRLRKLEIVHDGNLYKGCRNLTDHVSSLREVSLITRETSENWSGFVLLWHEQNRIYQNITKLHIDAKPILADVLARIVGLYPNIVRFIYNCRRAKRYANTAPAGLFEISQELLPWTKQLEYLEINISTRGPLEKHPAAEMTRPLLLNHIMSTFFDNKRYSSVKILIISIDGLVVTRDAQGVQLNSLSTVLSKMQIKAKEA